jgi:excisionase family DNA binding protein
MPYASGVTKPKLLSVRQAAQHLGVSIRTIRRLIADGRLPVITVRSLRMVPFGRIYGLKPTPVPHTEMRIELGAIKYDLLEGPRRKPTCEKDRQGKFIPKWQWPEARRQRNLTPIQRLDEIDISHLS